MRFTTMMVTLFVMVMFSITPLMLTIVPGGSGVIVGTGGDVAVASAVGAGVRVLAAACASTVMLWASSAPSAVSTPRMWAIVPRAGAPVITVCGPSMTGVPAITQRSWLICWIAPLR